MTIAIKWFPPSWVQIKFSDKIIYIDPAYLRTYFSKHPQKIEFKNKLESQSDIKALPLKIGGIYIFFKRSLVRSVIKNASFARSKP